MDLAQVFEFIPFVRELGIEIVELNDGYAKGKLELRDEHSSNPDRMIAHGGVTYSLADTLGGAAVFSLKRVPTPTIDMRMDYLHPAKSDLIAEAEVVRYGGSVAVVEIDVDDTEDVHVARATGVYKTGDFKEDSDWLQEDQQEALEDVVTD